MEKRYLTYLKIIQYKCATHQKRIIQRYITLNPKLEASQDLKKIMTRLKYSDEIRLRQSIRYIWYIKYKSS